MKNKRYFPMFVDLSDKSIVVVGGGNIATRRVKTLLSFTRNVTVIAPRITVELSELGKAGQIQILNRPVKRSDFRQAVSYTHLGKSIEQLVQDGIRTKVAAISEESQVKLQDTMQKIVNDSKGGLVCIII